METKRPRDEPHTAALHSSCKERRDEQQSNENDFKRAVRSTNRARPAAFNFRIPSDNSQLCLWRPVVIALRTSESVLHRIPGLCSAAGGQESYVGTSTCKVTESSERSISRVCLPVDGDRRGQALPGPELLASFMCPFALVSVCQ